MNTENVIIIGAGPCGLAAGIALQRQGYDPLLIEKKNVVHAISHYPLHQTFFSSSEKLEIGGYPFPSTERKPKRHEALVYYRQVAAKSGLRIHSYEQVESVEKESGYFAVETKPWNQPKTSYHAKKIVVATGYFDHPNIMDIPGEDYPHVFHYFRESHPYFQKKVTVIGGKNSAVDTALALESAGALVTVLYRGSEFSSAVKPWILPDFYSLVRHKKVDMVYEAEVQEITPTHVRYEKNGQSCSVASDFVFAMTGYHPDHSFLKNMGVEVETDTGRPVHDPMTMETNEPGIYIAGVLAAGNDANEIFIENGRHHGNRIASSIRKNSCTDS
ncbi:YpdA family putative bacillithiol disulfide reductase [Salibacterium qingdaonense]|uniref:Thioredoxin reductase (NADPH) n=1 Tax=Salibacterium qingdaonense TaxID=266892 RepID=A0A1I4M657_9BACI|nr:YpdA family putative bacillithiol disulfide reductase [Salibacterium qingdaonense]SFL98475.1 thioredoxin reductase (NADPH) [Salibacterium qingdaonense]